jgi:hypothetical protein
LAAIDDVGRKIPLQGENAFKSNHSKKVDGNKVLVQSYLQQTYAHCSELVLGGV